MTSEVGVSDQEQRQGEKDAAAEKDTAAAGSPASEGEATHSKSPWVLLAVLVAVFAVIFATLGRPAEGDRQPVGSMPAEEQVPAPGEDPSKSFVPGIEPDGTPEGSAAGPQEEDAIALTLELSDGTRLESRRNHQAEVPEDAVGRLVEPAHATYLDGTEAPCEVYQLQGREHAYAIALEGDENFYLALPAK